MQFLSQKKKEEKDLENSLWKRLRLLQRSNFRVLISIHFHCDRLGFKTAYLSTKDKQEFYAHLGEVYLSCFIEILGGYQECEAVTCLGENSKQLNKEQLKGLLQVLGGMAQQVSFSFVVC